MRVVAHVSDLHFGRTDQSALPALAQAIEAAQPDALVVSGDLTQRARTREFVEARAYLDSLPFPKIVVPGNHDIPLFNVLARGLTPLERYKKHISEETEPHFADDEIAIVGINTARSLTISGGRINKRQAHRTCQLFGASHRDVTRIVVTHHPFDLPEASDFVGLVGRARMAIRTFAACGVDIVLSGHMHIADADESTERYKAHGRSMLLVQAGTATSSRLRGEANSCNIIRIERPHIEIEHLEWDDESGDFVVATAHKFLLKEQGWARVR